MSELEELIENIYEDKLDYEVEYELDNGRMVYFSPSHYNNEWFEVSVSEGEEEVESWSELYPSKRCKEEFRKELVKKINELDI